MTEAKGQNMDALRISDDRRDPVICCQEKTVIFIDRSSEVNFMDLKLGDGKKVEGFHRLKKILRMHLQLKKILAAGRDNEYCLLTESNQGQLTPMPMKGLVEVDNVVNLVKRLESLDPNRLGDTNAVLRLDDIVRKCIEIAPLPPPPMDITTCTSPPYIVRLFLIVSRSSGEFKLEFDEELNKALQNPYLFVDVLYVHEYPNAGNHVNEIFKKLCSLDVNKKGYVFECGPDVTKWHECAAHLLAHPLLRRLFDQLVKERHVTKTNSAATATTATATNQNATASNDEWAGVLHSTPEAMMKALMERENLMDTP